MGSADGGLSAVYPLVLGTPQKIPAPTDTSLIDSVILYNYSPFLVQVSCGTSGGWLGAWSADRFSTGNANVTVIPQEAVGNIPASGIPPVARLTAAWVLSGTAQQHVGTYPVSLLDGVGLIVATELDVVSSSGMNSIVITTDVNGDPSILVYDHNGMLVGQWTKDGLVVQEPNDATKSIVVAPGNSSGLPFPTITFNTDPAHAPAFINATQSSLGNTQLGVNSGQYINRYGVSVYGRLYMSDEIIQLGSVGTATQNPFGGQVWASDDHLRFGVYNAAGTPLTDIYIFDTGDTSWTGRLFLDTLIVNNTVAISGLLTRNGANWQTVTFSNGWSWLGNPTWGPGGLKLPDGTVQLRGGWQGGTTANGTVVGTLPVGVRPTAGSGTNGRLQIPVLVAPATNAMATMQISTLGVCTIFGLGTNTMFYWDGISFQGEQ